MSASERKIAALEKQLETIRGHMNEATQVIFLLMAQSRTRHIQIPGKLFATIPPGIRYETLRDPLSNDLMVKFTEPATSPILAPDGRVASAPKTASGLILPG